GGRVLALRTGRLMHGGSGRQPSRGADYLVVARAATKVSGVPFERFRDVAARRDDNALHQAQLTVEVVAITRIPRPQSRRCPLPRPCWLLRSRAYDSSACTPATSEILGSRS